MSRLSVLALCLLGCKLSTSSVNPFAPQSATAAPPPAGAAPPTAAPPTASAPVSDAPVVAIASKCEWDPRTDEQKADGVPPPGCEEGSDPYWGQRKQFIRVKVAAAPGRAVVGRFRAPWCKAPYDRQADAFARLVQYARDGEKPMAGTEIDGARLLCIDPDDPRFQDLAGAYVQALVNETGGTVAEVTAYLSLFAEEDNYERLVAETCKAHAPADDASERERTIALLENAGLGCIENGCP